MSSQHDDDNDGIAEFFPVIAVQEDLTHGLTLKGGAPMGHWTRTIDTQGRLYVSAGTEVHVHPSFHRSRIRRFVFPHPLSHALKENVHVYAKNPDHVAVVKEFMPNTADIADSDQWEMALTHTDKPAQPLPRRLLHKPNSPTSTQHNPLIPDIYPHNNATKLHALFLLVGNTPVATIDVHTQIKLLDSDQLVFVDGLLRAVPDTPSLMAILGCLTITLLVFARPRNSSSQLGLTTPESVSTEDSEYEKVEGHSEYETEEEG